MLGNVLVQKGGKQSVSAPYKKEICSGSTINLIILEPKFNLEGLSSHKTEAVLFQF